MDNKKHWENIYQKKEIDGVSWYQKVPIESLQLIKKYSISNSNKIIDIEDCAKYSRMISEFLDKKNLISHDFSLEVSSPGIDLSLIHI